MIRGSGTYIKKEKASQASPAVNDDPIGLQENSEENLFQTGLEFVDVRLMLEPEVAAMAATNADYADCQKLQQIQKKVEDLVVQGKIILQRILSTTGSWQPAPITRPFAILWRSW